MSIRRSVRLAVAGLLAGVLGAVGFAGPAHASVWQLTDGFESNPAARWQCWNSVNDPEFVNGCNIGFDSPNPHGGVLTSWVQGHSGWTEVGRHVSITPFLAGRRLTCATRFYVKQLDFVGEVHGQVEVIDRDTWTYVSVKPFTLGEDDYLHWRSVTTATWVPPRKNVFIRIGLIGPEVGEEVDWFEVDDMQTSCSY